MISSPVQIINVALTQIRAGVIHSLDDESVEAQEAAALWENARRSEMADHPWDFAQKRVELAESTTDPVFRFEKRFALPSDFLRLLTVYNDNDYKVEGQYIVTSKDTCHILYVCDHEIVSDWSPIFVDLMTARMRMDLAYARAGSARLVGLVIEQYEKIRYKARWKNAAQTIPDEIRQDTSTFITVRHGG